MNNEIEEITDLFDEFFIIDSSPEIQRATHTNNTEQVISQPKPEPEKAMEPEVNKPVEDSLPSLIFSGANKRHIVVIYNDKNNDSRENVEMLSNLITKALKFSMHDVAIIRLSKNPHHTLSQIFEQTSAEKTIIWGAKDLCVAENLMNDIHTLIKYKNSDVLIADEVFKYHNNASYKGQLWEAIQKLFA